MSESQSILDDTGAIRADLRGPVDPPKPTRLADVIRERTKAKGVKHQPKGSEITTSPETPHKPEEAFKAAAAERQSFVGLIPTEPPLTPPEPKHPGRRTLDSYTQDTIETLFLLLSEGYTLNRICMRDDMPAASTVSMWSVQNRVFGERYARARQAGLLRRADNLRDEIALHPDPIKARLLFEHDKWFLSKMLPKTFGDRIVQDVNVTTEVRHVIDVSRLSPEEVEALEGVLISAKALPVPEESS